VLILDNQSLDRYNLIKKILLVTCRGGRRVRGVGGGTERNHVREDYAKGGQGPACSANLLILGLCGVVWLQRVRSACRQIEPGNNSVGSSDADRGINIGVAT
jgi:hypothetical protein